MQSNSRLTISRVVTGKGSDRTQGSPIGASTFRHGIAVHETRKYGAGIGGLGSNAGPFGRDISRIAARRVVTNLMRRLRASAPRSPRNDF
jgi:hypothetical protein